MIARDTQFIHGIVNANNTIEILIALNEFANHLISESRSADSIQYSLFWLDWISYYNKTYKRNIGKELKYIQMYKHTDIDPKYRDNYIWYVWDIIFSILHIVESRISRVIFTYLKRNIDSLHGLYKYEITKGNMNRRVIYVKYAVLLIKKDITLDKYENTPSHMDAICLKACANVNELYRHLLKNYKTYVCSKKVSHLTDYIQNVSAEFITDEELANRIMRNKERQKRDKELAKYFENKKYGKERIDEELNIIQNHEQTVYDRNVNDCKTANAVYILREKERRQVRSN